MELSKEISQKLSKLGIKWEFTPKCPLNTLGNVRVDIRDRTISRPEHQVLGKSLDIFDLIIPIVVYENESGKIEILDGQTRKDLALAKGIHFGPVIKIISQLTEQEKVILNSIFNSSQAKISDEEMRLKLKEYQGVLSPTDWAVLTGRSATKIRDIARTTELSDETIEATRDKRDHSLKVTEQVARIVSTTPKEDKEEIEKETTKFTVSNVLTKAKKRDVLRTVAREYSKAQQSEPERLGLKSVEVLQLAEHSKNSLFISPESKPRFSLFKIFLKDEDFEEAYAFNVGIRQRINRDDNNIVDMEGEMIRTSIPKFTLIDALEIVANIWKRQLNIKIITSLAETYLRKHFPLERDKKKTLLHFNLSGNHETRLLLSVPMLESLKKARPDLVISSIIVDEFSNPTSKGLNDLEIISFFGLDEEDRKKPITNLEGYLEKLSTISGWIFEIKWSKTGYIGTDYIKRRVAWIIGRPK